MSTQKLDPTQQGWKGTRRSDPGALGKKVGALVVAAAIGHPRACRCSWGRWLARQPAEAPIRPATVVADELR